MGENSGVTSSEHFICNIDVSLVNYHDGECRQQLNWTQSVSYKKSNELGCRSCCSTIMATNDFTELPRNAHAASWNAHCLNAASVERGQKRKKSSESSDAGDE